jgi:cytochrome c oxidase subunit 2
VLHDFAVAQFRVKMDMVPGMITTMWFTPTKTGDYDILCEELCGTAHFAMRGRVVVDDEATFKAWLATKPTYAATSTSANVAVDTVAGAALYSTCAACHGASGEGNLALNAPKLAGQQGWYLQRQLKNFKQGVRGTHQNDTYGAQMVPFAGMLADEAAVRNLVAYIETMPDTRPAPTMTAGNAAHGAVIYRTCAACHGESGQGLQAMEAPRLAQMSDWYLARQLKNFKEGVRGSHHQDFYGSQMVLITGAVADSGAISDLVSHINTLQPADTKIAMASVRRP